MVDHPGATAAMAVALVMALSAGCATSSPASLASSSAPARPTPTAVLTPGDSHCRVDAPPPGFPTELLPVPPDADLLLACATQPDGSAAGHPADGFWDVSLNIRSTADVAALLDTVRQPLLTAGFAEQSDSPAVGVAAQSTFSRAEGEVLTMSVLDDGTVRTLTIGGSVMTQAPDGNR